MEIYPQNIDGVTLGVENLQVKLCDVYVGRPTGDLAHHCIHLNKPLKQGEWDRCIDRFECYSSKIAAIVIGTKALKVSIAYCL